MRALTLHRLLDMHSFLVFLWKGWSILTYGHLLYTTVNNIGWQSSGSFFLGLAIAYGSPCGLDLYSTSIAPGATPSEFPSYSLSNSSLPVFFSAPGMSSSRLPWLSSLYSYNIVTMEVQGCKLKPLSAWTLWSSALYERLDTLLSGFSWDITKSKAALSTFSLHLAWLIHPPTHLLEGRP